MAQKKAAYTFVEEHSNTGRTPYLFNGKELDEETGLYYYGERYYNPKTSIWQSVDGNSSDTNPSNTYSNDVLGKIINQANKSKTNKGKIEVIIQKRTAAERTTTKTEPLQ